MVEKAGESNSGVYDNKWGFSFYGKISSRKSVLASKLRKINLFMQVENKTDIKSPARSGFIDLW